MAEEDGEEIASLPAEIDRLREFMKYSQAARQRSPREGAIEGGYRVWR